MKQTINSKCFNATECFLSRIFHFQWIMLEALRQAVPNEEVLENMGAVGYLDL